MYAKVFAQIFDSSIADDYELRHFFMDLLVLADADGMVDMTPTAIAGRTRIPIEKVSAFLTRLENPDSESRTPDGDGRRIVRLDDHRTWGWIILNYDTFRKIASEEQRKSSAKARQQRRRAKIREKTNETSNVTPLSRPVTPCSASVTPIYASPSPYASPFQSSQGGCRGDLPEVEVPSWQEVQSECQKIGLVEWRARDWFDEMQQCGWKDSKNREVMDWRAFLARVRTWWERDGRPLEPPSKANGASNSAADAIRHQTALQRVEDRLKVIRGQFPLSDCDPLKEEFKELKAERDRLKKLLGFKA